MEAVAFLGFYYGIWKVALWRLSWAYWWKKWKEIESFGNSVNECLQATRPLNIFKVLYLFVDDNKIHDYADNQEFL
jgi:hypothetical protein